MRQLSSEITRKLSIGILTAGLLSIGSNSASAVTTTWTGTFDGTDLGNANNWSTGVLPSAATPDTAQWDGTAAGDLSLTINGVALAGAIGNVGIALSVTATQTGTLTINALSDSSIRTSGLTIAAGAGAVSFGTTGSNLTLNLGGAWPSAQTFTNNSTNAVTFGSHVLWNLGGGGNHDINFNGSGNWVFNAPLSFGSARPSLFFSGTGTVTLNGANGAVNNDGAVYIGGNSATGTGVVRVAATQALGNIALNIGQGGNDNTGRMELVGGVSMSNALFVFQRNNTSVSIQNIDGNNTLSGKITLDAGGTQGRIQSDAGSLTLSGGITAAAGAASARSLYLQGAGNGTVTGIISDGTTQKLSLTKEGTGTWTLSGLNTYTGNTTVNEGTLALTSTGQMTFTIGANGVNTQLLGNGSGTAVVTLDGTFAFNLTGAGTTAGDSWIIIDYASLPSVTFGGTFAVSGFHSNDGVTWTSDSGLYEFNQYSGVLTAVPEPGTVILLIGGLTALLVFRRRRQDA